MVGVGVADDLEGAKTLEPPEQLRPRGVMLNGDRGVQIRRAR
jgi:hypothetical protein